MRWCARYTSYIRKKCLTSMAGDVQGVAVTGACRFIIAATVPTEEHIGSKTWSPCVGIATS
jgi:hypothetical protein